MKKQELLDRILGHYTEEEWEGLEKKTLGIPVNETNRKTLLELQNTHRRFRGEADDAQVEELTGALKEYLDEVWAEEPLAHKYVIDVSLINTFLYGIPMHPRDSVGYYVTVRDGEPAYYCPHKQDSVICGFCRAKRCDELFEKWDKITAATRERWGETSARIQRKVFETGFLESGVIDTKDLAYHEEARKECEKNRCGAYGTTWACPPAVGTVEECRQRVSRFGRMLLFSKAYAMENTMDMEAAKRAMSDFKVTARALDRALKEEGPGEYRILSNESCDRCRKCTYPDSPCRFPEELHHSIEGYGFYVLELTRQAGIKYINGQKVFTFFGAVLYDEEPVVENPSLPSETGRLS